MKKSVLWFIAIGAGMISCLAGLILAVMYFRAIYTYTAEKLIKWQIKKDKVLLQMLSQQEKAGIS